MNNSCHSKCWYSQSTVTVFNNSNMIIFRVTANYDSRWAMLSTATMCEFQVASCTGDFFRDAHASKFRYEICFPFWNWYIIESIFAALFGISRTTIKDFKLLDRLHLFFISNSSLLPYLVICFYIEFSKAIRITIEIRMELYKNI